MQILLIILLAVIGILTLTALFFYSSSIVTIFYDSKKWIIHKWDKFINILKTTYGNIKKWVIGNWKKILGVTIGGMVIGGGAIMFPRDEPPAADVWTNPDTTNDPDTKWSNDDNAKDGAIGTIADLVQANQGYYLELLLTSQLYCDKVSIYGGEFWRGGYVANQGTVTVAVYYNSAWHEIWNNQTLTKETATTITIDSGTSYYVTKARITAYTITGGRGFGLSYLQFNATSTGSVAGGFMWKTPDTVWDSNGNWDNEGYARDDSESTCASTLVNYSYLQFNLSSLYNCSKVRVKARNSTFPTVYDPNVTADVYYGGGWQEIHNATITKETWVTMNISAGNVSTNKARFCFKELAGGAQDYGQLYEFDFGVYMSPEQSNPYPYNNSIDINTTYFKIDIQIDEDSTVYFRTNGSGTWKDFNQSNNVQTGMVYGYNTSWITQDETKYWWSVNCSCNDAWSNETYDFTSGNTSYDMFIITTLDYYDEAVDFHDWKESNSDFSVGVRIQEDIINNSNYWVNGTWGDNKNTNPYYISQTISVYSKYNDSACNVRNFVRYADYTYDPDYIVLHGEDVEHRNITMWGCEKVQTTPWDTLWYACLNGTQNLGDDQSSWGMGDEGNYTDGITDTVQDIVVSRFLFTTLAEWNSIFNKTKSYYGISSSDEYSRTFALYSESLNISANDHDHIWTGDYVNPEHALNLTTYLGDLDKNANLIFVNGTGVGAPGQVGQFDNCMTQEQVEDDFIGIVNCTNNTHPHSFILYCWHTHDDNGFNQSYVSSAFTNNSYPFICYAEGCSAGNWLGPSKQMIKSIKGEGGSVVVIGSAQDLGVLNSNFFIDELYDYNESLGKVFSRLWTYGVVTDSNIGRGGINLYGDPSLVFKYQENPYVGDVSPDDEIAGFALTNLSARVLDYENETLTSIKFRTNASGSWTNIHSWTNVASNTTLYYDATNFTSYETKYWWSVNCTDGTYWLNKTVSFTTSAQGNVSLTNMYPFYDVTSIPSSLYIEYTKNTNAIVTIYIKGIVSGVWKTLGTYDDPANQQVSCTNTSHMDTDNTLYTWSCNISDGTAWVNQSFPVIINASNYPSGVSLSSEFIYPDGNYTTPDGAWKVEPDTDELWEAIDESTIDYNTTYIWNTNNVKYTIHNLTLQNPSKSDSTISHIQVNFTTYNNFSHPAKKGRFCISVKDSTKNYTYWWSTAESEMAEWQNWSLNFTYNPLTLTTWTIADLNDLVIGVGIYQATAGGYGRVTRLRAETKYYHYPKFSSETPTNKSSVNTSLSQLSINIEDGDGDTFNWTIQTSPNIGSSSANDASNGTKTCSVSGLTGGNNYTWYVNCTDGYIWTNETYWFIIHYNTTVRTDGIDYFVWLGTNTSAWHIQQILVSLGFDEGIEYIAVWRNQ